MQINPHAWVVTVPLALILIQAYWLPSNHAVKRFWSALCERESATWDQIGCPQPPFDLHGKPRAQRALFAMVMTGLAMSSLASFAAYIGVFSQM